ncbi:MAG TPA: menaquinone biosynthesis protein [Pirellulales bacterium]|jgi:chorismate dehydratase|nr:menaquinone biosynthesis protein [Pirellulales bacterium]
MHSRSKVRIGAVTYLNTKPLIYELERLAPQAELVLDYPSRLADRLADGELDLALIPSIEFFQRPGYTIVSDACIACRGPVLSVKLFSRVPIEQLQTLALDEGSRTSIAMVRILLCERYGIEPRLEPLPLGASLADTRADAAVLIGDRAMRSAGEACAEVWDLGDEWCRWAELPFVFAMWVARVGTDLQGVEQALSQSRDLGVANLETIARREAAPLGLTQPECVGYLRDNLYFTLGERELRGLELFYRMAQQLNLAPPGVDLGFDCQRAG